MQSTTHCTCVCKFSEIPIATRRRVKHARMKMGASHAGAFPPADWLVFNKIKAALGGRVRFIISGGAPLGTHVEDFINVALAPVLQVRACDRRMLVCSLVAPLTGRWSRVRIEGA